MAALDVLRQPIRELEPAVAAMTDVEELAALGRAERNGSHRAGVLNLLQARIGELMTDPSVSRAVRQAERGETGETSEPLLDVPGNREMGANAVAGGVVTQRRAPNVVIYFPTEIGVFMPRYIPAGSEADCLRTGAMAYCPDCGRTNCGIGAGGEVLGDMNACPARGPVPFARCTICGKRVYDVLPTQIPEEGLEPGEVTVDLGAARTPAQRLRARLDVHILAFHSDQARVLGIRQMPEPGQVVAGGPA